jgi:hypothetical protein
LYAGPTLNQVPIVSLWTWQWNISLIIQNKNKFRCFDI